MYNDKTPFLRHCVYNTVQRNIPSFFEKKEKLIFVMDINLIFVGSRKSLFDIESLQAFDHNKYESIYNGAQHQ